MFGSYIVSKNVSFFLIICLSNKFNYFLNYKKIFISRIFSKITWFFSANFLLTLFSIPNAFIPNFSHFHFSIYKRSSFFSFLKISHFWTLVAVFTVSFLFFFFTIQTVLFSLFFSYSVLIRQWFLFFLQNISQQSIEIIGAVIKEFFVIFCVDWLVKNSSRMNTQKVKYGKSHLHWGF